MKAENTFFTCLFTEFFSHLGRLVLNEVIVKFKVLVILEYITKKHKYCGITVYNLCVKTGYMCNMRLCLGTDSHPTTDKITVTTHSTMRHLTRRVEGAACKLLVTIYFLLHTRLSGYYKTTLLWSCLWVHPHDSTTPTPVQSSAFPHSSPPSSLWSTLQIRPKLFLCHTA